MSDVIKSIDPRDDDVISGAAASFCISLTLLAGVQWRHSSSASHSVPNHSSIQRAALLGEPKKKKKNSKKQ